MARKPLARLSDPSVYLLATVAEPFKMVIKSATVIDAS